MTTYGVGTPLLLVKGATSCVDTCLFWTLWEERTARFFQDKRWDLKQLIDMITMRVAIWASPFDIFQGISIDSLIRVLVIARSVSHVPQV